MIEIPTDKAQRRVRTDVRYPYTWYIEDGRLIVHGCDCADEFSEEEQENLRQVLNYLHEQKEN